MSTIIEPPIVLKINLSGIEVEVCHGSIPNTFRESFFNPITEFELPDAKRSDEEFEDWIEFYSISDDGWAHIMLEASICN